MEIGNANTNAPAAARAELGVAGKVVKAFIDSKLTPLVLLASILLGIGAVVLLPREEEPQIKVPMIDVLVSMPGASAKEVEERATRPMEKLLWEIPGVEYIYSTSSPGQALAIVRFEVGEDVERALVRLNQKLQSNFDRIPHGVSFPLIKARSIDDVPILALTFHSRRYDHLTLRRLVAQVDDAVKQVSQVAETRIIGGLRRQVRVLLDPVRLASRNLSPAGLIPMLRQANRQVKAGGIAHNNNEVIVETGGFLTSAEDVGGVVVGVFGGRPVYLREVADIVDGAEEPSQYVFFGYGAARSAQADEQPAVTLTVAKRPGANAITVTHQVLKQVETLKGVVIPGDVEITVTRDYGETAAEKSDELLLHMAIAVVSVSLLILFILGWREAGIVGTAIPATLALTLFVFYLYGFTLNRITLFALIFSIGILVDDAIVVVENIVRHFHLPQNKGRPWTAIAVEAVSEVGNPTILATLAVIAAVLPMAFVGGYAVDLVHLPREKEDVELVVELPRALRSWAEDLLSLRVRSGDANALPEPGAVPQARPLIPLRELVRVEHTTTDKSIYHKNLRPVTYVIGDVAGVIESPVYAILQMNRKVRQLDMREFGNRGAHLDILNFHLPFSDRQLAMKWDGEWHITIRVFRDLGVAFMAVLVLIYVLMVGWFRSFLTPAVVMAVIPLSLIGILPAPGALGAFFTATSMIGFMAGAGIVVRNSIILVDFIELRLSQGMSLEEAVVDAGAVRFRPMLLTAMAVVVGAAVILFDPIFQGLAISLMAGEVASLFISRMTVPLLYYMEARFLDGRAAG